MHEVKLSEEILTDPVQDVFEVLVVIEDVLIASEKLIEKLLPDGANRHRVLGRVTMVIYALILITSTATYLMLYYIYPLKS